MSRFLSMACALVALATTSGCRTHDGCKPLDSRCDAKVALLCNADSDWIVVADCDALSRLTDHAWLCAVVSLNDEGAPGATGATCVSATAARPLVAGASL